MSNNYWNGLIHPVLKPDDVTASWVKKDTTGVGLLAVNKAFCIWYHGRKTIEKIEAEDMNLYISNKKKSLGYSACKSLEYCGYAGWGLGVQDLDDAFKHIIKNNGKRTDEKSTISYNGRGRFIGYGKIPNSIVNFLNAIDAARPNINKALSVYTKKTQELSRLKITGNTPTKVRNLHRRLKSILGLFPPKKKVSSIKI